MSGVITTIDQLPAATSGIDGTEEIPFQRAGITGRMTSQQVADLAGGGVSSVNAQTGAVVLDAADVGAVPTTVGASPSGAEGDEIVVVLKGSIYVYLTTQQIANLAGAAALQCIPVACSDETTALTVGTAKVTFRNPFNAPFTLTDIKASLTTAQASGSIFTVDVNESGVSILSTKITIDNTETTSTTAVAPPVISDPVIASDAEMTVDIDQVGDGTATGLKVYLIGHL